MAEQDRTNWDPYAPKPRQGKLTDKPEPKAEAEEAPDEQEASGG